MLDAIGLSGWVEPLHHEVLAPLATRIFPDTSPTPPPNVHAFSVEYGRSADRDLAQHVDDSQVTVNLWLGGEAEGSAVVFEGHRCLNHLDVPPRAEEIFRWVGVPGEALIHRGLHRHRTTPIHSGKRQSIIFWLQDPQVRKATFESAQRNACDPHCGAPKQTPMSAPNFVFDP